MSVLGFIVINSAFLSSIVVLLGISLLKSLPKIQRLIPHLLKRIGMGLLMFVAEDAIYMAILTSSVETEAVKDPVGVMKWFYPLYCPTYTDHRLQDATLLVNSTFL